MSKSSQHIKLGIFVISATVLLVIAIIVLAGRRWGGTEYPAYTTLDESAQGLEIGAPVKFRGVPVGSVRRITIQDKDLEVRVDMELYEGSIQIRNRSIREFLLEQVKHGARCRLEITGITGFRYIGIEMHPEDQIDGRESKRLSRKGPLYIPSVRSLLAGVTSDISYTLAELGEIDFKSIGLNIDQLLSKFNNYIEDERIGSLIDNLSETVSQLKGLSTQLNEADIGMTMQKVHKTLDNLDGLITDVHGEVGKAEIAGLTREINQAIRQVSSAAASFDKFSKNADQAVADSDFPRTMTGARRTLNDIQATLDRNSGKLAETLDALTRLAELLEQDTDALIRGKQTPPAEIGAE